MGDYAEFLERKKQLGGDHGFDPLWMPDFLFDFQRVLVEWALKKGRSAIFADCGMGKTPIQLAWAENVVRKTNGRVLIVTPLAVGTQTAREGDKFGIECIRSADGDIGNHRIVVTNYERLHYFNSADFAGVVCDESSILKNVDGVTKSIVTEFMRRVPYRLLCTATPAPNDYLELGTSSEALGCMGFMDMLSRFFKKVDSTKSRSEEYRGEKWRFRGYAERDFWRWICSWARAVRKPSDLGGDDSLFVLPELQTKEHVVSASISRAGFLFDLPALSLEDQREERTRTISERCEKAAEIANATRHPVICWCHLNKEGDMIEKLIPDSKQVSGSDSEEHKERIFNAFSDGDVRVLVTKPKIGGFGMNWQHCAHQTFFPSHSFEQWYQAVRRSWRFGQTRPVIVDMISSEGERGVMANLKRKTIAADEMFGNLVKLMNDQLRIESKESYNEKEEIPSWA